MISESPRSRGPRAARWWPAVLILVVAVVAAVRIWFIPHASQQALNIQLAQLMGGALGLLLLWFLLFSRLRWRTRCRVLGLTLAGFGLLLATVRIRGFSGNLVPILEPRWARHELRTPAPVAPVAGLKPPPRAADFPQFLGPNRDGRLPGPILATNWTAQLPVQVWRHPVGAGWSGFAVAGGLAITQEQRGEEECVVAYALQTGAVLWSHADKRRYYNTLAGEGPRATPTITGQRVLAHGATGALNCLNLADGRVLWSRNGMAGKEDAAPTWGEATSPLVENDLVIFSAGGPEETSLVACRLADGSTVWSAATRWAGYSSPLSATLGGTRQVLIFANGLLGIEAATGRQLWRFPWPGGHPHVATPVVVSDSELVLSSGYGTGSARVKVERDAAGQWSASTVWRTNRMKAKFTNLIVHRGYLYGLDDGILECLDLATGGLAWKEGRYGHGQILLVGELLLVLAESGDIIPVDPQPDRLRELTRFTALHEKTWNPPAVAGEYLLVRNDKEAACFRMPVRK